MLISYNPLQKNTDTKVFLDKLLETLGLITFVTFTSNHGKIQQICINNSNYGSVRKSELIKKKEI